MSDLRGDAYGTVRVEGPVNEFANRQACGDEKWYFYFDYLGIDMDFSSRRLNYFDRIYLINSNMVFDESGNEGMGKGQYLPYCI